MRAYVHCCIALHPCFSAKPQHANLTNRIPGSGSQHNKHCMHACLEPGVCTPSSAHKSTVAARNQTINGFAPMSSSEVKLLCLEPDRLCAVPSIACNVICSVLGNARITLGSPLTRNYTAYVSRNRH